MSVATDTARVGSLAGSPTMKRLGAAIAMVALAASIVGAAALLSPNPGPAPETFGVTEEVRQAWINKNAAISGVYDTPTVGQLPGASGGPHERIASSTRRVELPSGRHLEVPLSTSPPLVPNLAAGSVAWPTYLTQIEDQVFGARTPVFEPPYTEPTPKPFVERPGAPK